MSLDPARIQAHEAGCFVRSATSLRRTAGLERALEIIETVGMTLFLGAQSFDSGAQWYSEMSAGLWFGCLLNGKVSVERSDYGREVWSAGDYSCFWLNDDGSTHHKALSSGDIGCMFFHIAPENMEHVLGPEAMRVFNSDRKQLASDISTHVQSPAVKAMAWQMLGTPVNGCGRVCFLAGKALEILGMTIDTAMNKRITGECVQAPGAEGAPSHLRPSDIESIFHARDVILHKLHDPPTVQRLAAEVGINSRKLNEGFKALFGAPVYSFAKTERMRSARLMIEAGETSVSKVAYKFGYTPSHFATEFRKTYGISPKAFSLGKKMPFLEDRH